MLRIVSFGIALLAMPVSLLYFAFELPAQYRDTFVGALYDKVDALKHTDGKRIILVGGSSVAFGLRSDLLETEFSEYSVINLGMYAGLGSTVTLELAAQQMRPGDIIVFSPEQNAQTLSLYFNAETMWQAADGHFGLLQSVCAKDRSALIGQLPYFASQKAQYYFTGNAPDGDGIYARLSFNRWGDIQSSLRERNVMISSFDPNMPILFDPALPDSAFVSYLNEYEARCVARGVSFFYSFCPMNAAAVSPSEVERVSAYQTALESKLQCKVLGRAEDAILEPVWFFDTNFHLNSAGAVVNTIRLAGELKTALFMPAEVGIAYPQPPASASMEVFPGDDTDAYSFRYRQTDQGMVITGLTEKGAQKTSLIIPTQYNGAAVIGFTVDTFAGQKTLEELTIQGNIKSIEDASFAGCLALRRIVIRQPSPSDILVGQGLLTDTTADLFVPGESLGAYKTNYFWSAYAANIQGELSTDAHAAASVASQLTTASNTDDIIVYDGNGGTLISGQDTTITIPYDAGRLRVNTLQGTRVFTREGYALVSWNTQADGSGTAIGLGSRVTAVRGMTLYAQWLAESKVSDFTWETRGNQAWITGYCGHEDVCVIPATLGGLPVYGVCSGAFRSATISTLVLPSGLAAVEQYAFAESTVKELYLYDSLQAIDDESFDRCLNLTTLHINAVVNPAYSISFYATFADKFDRLLLTKGSKKLVLFSGSSTRYGFDSAMLSDAYPEYQVTNMGVFAYSNALPQLAVILAHMEPDDVLLHAPEFDTLDNQFCEDTAFDAHVFAMMEANYDMLVDIDVKAYTHVFSSLSAYLQIRLDMPQLGYQQTPDHYDDGLRQYGSYTYNRFGDFILDRPNEEQDVLLQHTLADYTTSPFTAQRLASLNQVYRRFLDKGIQVYFTYSPRNRSSLTPESTPEARQALDQLLRNALCVPVISPIEDSLYSGVYFYLVDSHLSSEGVSIRTQKVIRDLQPWLVSK